MTICPGPANYEYVIQTDGRFEVVEVSFPGQTAGGVEIWQGLGSAHRSVRLIGPWPENLPTAELALFDLLGALQQAVVQFRRGHFVSQMFGNVSIEPHGDRLDLITDSVVVGQFSVTPSGATELHLSLGRSGTTNLDVEGLEFALWNASLTLDREATFVDLDELAMRGLEDEGTAEG